MKNILALTDRELYQCLEDEMISYFMAAIDDAPSLKYIKLGVEFCSKLFNAIDIEKLISLFDNIIKRGLKLIFAVPTIKAIDYNAFEKVKTIDSRFDSIVWQVNDFGAFYYIKGLSDKNLVCAGRLFDRRVRDIRIRQYEKSYGPLSKFQYMGYLNALKQFGFCGATIDNYKINDLCFEKIEDFFLIINENVVLSVTGRDCSQNCNYDCIYEKVHKFDEECFVQGNALLWNIRENSSLERFDFVEKSFRL